MACRFRVLSGTVPRTAERRSIMVIDGWRLVYVVVFLLLAGFWPASALIASHRKVKPEKVLFGGATLPSPSPTP